MSRRYDVVVVGAGSAGVAAAADARKHKDTSSILLVNEETHAPYDRTVLSKTIANDEGSVQPLQADGWYREHRIDRIDGTAVSAIDRAGRTVSVGDETIEYGSLVLATGAEPLFPKLVRPHERGSFYVVRHARDAEELKTRARKAKSVLIAGMGVLAVEIAQQLATLGKRITLAGATPQLMPRQLSARAGELLEEAMIREKLKLLFQEEIISFEENGKHAWSVEMLKHSAHYDMVVFCIGVTPRVNLAAGAGLSIDTGILVDARMRTDDDHVYAAGDCAQLPDGRISYLWKEAAAQGRVAGVNAAGGDASYAEIAFPLHTAVFGIDLFSIGKPRKLWNYRIDEFEVGNRYYAFYWNENTLHGAIVLNDPDTAVGATTAVQEGWDRERVDRELNRG